MSNVKFFSFNLANQETTTVTGTTEDAFFPASNIKDHRTTKVYRTPEGTSTAEIVFDLTTSEAVDSVLVQGNRVSDGLGFTTLTIQANPTDSWGSPAFSTTLTPNFNYDMGIETFPEETYRFWRLVATTTGSYVEVSKVFIGKAVQLAVNNIDFGWKEDNRDPSKIKTNRYNQKFIDKLPTIRKLNGSFKLLNVSEMETLMDMFHYNNKTNPVWYIVDEDEVITTEKERFMIYGFFDDIPDPVNTTFKLYDLDFSITEAT